MRFVKLLELYVAEKHLMNRRKDYLQNMSICIVESPRHIPLFLVHSPNEDGGGKCFKGRM